MRRNNSGHRECPYWHVELPKHDAAISNAAIGSSWSGCHAPSSTPKGRWRHFLLCTMSDSEEIWKPIPEYEDRYEVSNKGRVRSVDRTVTDSLGRTRQLKGKVLRQNYMGIGYRCVALHKNGNQKTHAVHSLVASAFLEDPPGPIGVNSGEYQVNHLDGDKTNNSAENLEWCTLEENHNHAWENGHHDRGQNRPFSKLTPQKVKEARRKYRDISLSFAQLGERYGVAMETIRQAIRGETWAHVEDPPPVTD